MEKREKLLSKLNKIEKWCLYCFMIFCYLKVNGIKGLAVLASQVHLLLKERKSRKR